MLLAALTAAAGAYYALLLALEAASRLLGPERPRGEPERWPSLAVVVPARDEEVVLADTLDALSRAEYPGEWEVLVVVAPSSDRTLEVARGRAGGRVRVLEEAPDGRGKSHALNQALREARAEVVVVYDADSVVERGSVRELVRPVACGADGAVGRLVPSSPRDTAVSRTVSLEYAWYNGGLNVHRSSHGLFVPLPGRNFALRRSVLEEVGGFDEEALTEDLNITRRVYAGRWRRVVYVPRAVITEEVPDELGPLLRQRRRWGGGAIDEYLRAFSEAQASAYYMGRLLDLGLMGLDIVMPVVALVSLVGTLAGLGQPYPAVLLVCALIYLSYLSAFGYRKVLLLYLPLTSLLDLYMDVLAPIWHLAYRAARGRRPAWERTVKKGRAWATALNR